MDLHRVPEIRNSDTDKERPSLGAAFFCGTGFVKGARGGWFVSDVDDNGIGSAGYRFFSGVLNPADAFSDRVRRVDRESSILDCLIAADRRRALTRRMSGCRHWKSWCGCVGLPRGGVFVCGDGVRGADIIESGGPASPPRSALSENRQMLHRDSHIPGRRAGGSPPAKEPTALIGIVSGRLPGPFSALRSPRRGPVGSMPPGGVRW